MSDLNIDWDKVLDDQTQDPQSGAAPDGSYDVRVTSAKATRASTGNPMIKVTCEITTGPYATKPIWTNIVLKTDSVPTMRMALQRLTALGVSREWIASTNPSLETIASQIVGAEAVAELTSREWNGELRNDVKTFKATGTGSGTPPAPSVGPSVGAAPSVPSAPAVPPAPTIPEAAAEAPAPAVAPPVAPAAPAPEVTPVAEGEEAF